MLKDQPQDIVVKPTRGLISGLLFGKWENRYLAALPTVQRCLLRVKLINVYKIIWKNTISLYKKARRYKEYKLLSIVLKRNERISSFFNSKQLHRLDVSCMFFQCAKLQYLSRGF